MHSWNRLNARFGVTPALLGFNRDARPAGDEWLAAFTAAFRGQPPAAPQATGTARPLLAPHASAGAGARPRAIYTATGPILAAAYQTLIDRRPPPPAAVAADPARPLRAGQVAASGGQT